MSEEKQEWVQIAAGWKKDQGRISLAINEKLAAGQSIMLFPNKFKETPEDGRPDFVYSVKAEQYDPETGKITYTKN